MTWNYRVMEFIDVDGTPFQEIREVYYNSEGKPNGYADRGATVGSETIPGLTWVLERMREAIDKPILRESDFNEVVPK